MAISWKTKTLSALRMIWLRSRERGDAIKETDRRCCCCGVRQSAAKGREAALTVHHLHRPNWERILTVIKEELFSEPVYLWPMCNECHEDLHFAEDEGIDDFEFISLKHEELFNIPSEFSVIDDEEPVED